MEIAAVGVSIAIFNQASKVTIFPLVSITTSFVAQENTTERLAVLEMQRKSEMVKVKADDIILDNLVEGGSLTNIETKEVQDVADDIILDNLKQGGTDYE